MHHYEVRLVSTRIALGNIIHRVHCASTIMISMSEEQKLNRSEPQVRWTPIGFKFAGRSWALVLPACDVYRHD
jgi:hypothetical protein